jgi:hypothetical protein
MAQFATAGPALSVVERASSPPRLARVPRVRDSTRVAWYLYSYAPRAGGAYDYPRLVAPGCAAVLVRGGLAALSA